MTTAVRTSSLPARNDPQALPPWKLVLPRGGYVSSMEAFTTAMGVPGFVLLDLGTLAGGQDAHRLLGLRYLIANGEVWRTHFGWQRPLEAALRRQLNDEVRVQDLLSEAEDLLARIRDARASMTPADQDGFAGYLEAGLLRALKRRDFEEESFLKFLILEQDVPSLREQAAELLRARAGELYREDPQVLDLLYAAVHRLDGYPATTVSAGQLKYILVADKGEMGVRATREAIALGKVPVVLYSLKDDENALQVRIALEGGGFAVGLEGSFRESYANYLQIADKVRAEFERRFGEGWQEELARAGLYPGYGPLAENAGAIRHFRQKNIVFIGPMQDVVESAGDKRKFRLMAQELDPSAVTPGLVIDSDDPGEIQRTILETYAAGGFTFPGRLKAANGGGGRGQAVIPTEEQVPQAIQKVLGEIKAYNWQPGVMFEQNIPETIHLEVQVLRDRYGNTRHFGMRDCSEQRASQKIQEEAPPALLRRYPGLEDRICRIAVQIAERVGYVGAGTVELMFKDGKFYFLEMNTRIQVEHPVSEESYGIKRKRGRAPVNLVAWQMRIADGQAIDFEQQHVVQTHCSREFRINAESWKPEIRDSRDGGKGLFLPNAGIFDRIALPDTDTIREALADKGLTDLKIRFDCGFEEGDVLVNKDPTFGKLIVSVSSKDPDKAYELLRLASLEVLKKLKIEGRQVRPDGTPISDSPFKTNIQDHVRILRMPLFKRHSSNDDRGRHVNWVVAAFRAEG
ncbi:biotin carboxylase [Sorangium cellulosum]|uniref:Biotin carboxylase n=1 Tax=Sorangium cellulosum TaxID=56 RepID=A0A2L0EXJ9_SORCE|nr:biotin carboxylase N-terminal domain-containing protein [Sorangium cellulosum]AUX43995.1 biotin carboxylase [Sorangium cellulosum]